MQTQLLTTNISAPSYSDNFYFTDKRILNINFTGSISITSPSFIRCYHVGASAKRRQTSFSKARPTPSPKVLTGKQVKYFSSSTIFFTDGVENGTDNTVKIVASDEDATGRAVVDNINAASEIQSSITQKLVDIGFNNMTEGLRDTYLKAIRYPEGSTKKNRGLMEEVRSEDIHALGYISHRVQVQKLEVEASNIGLEVIHKDQSLNISQAQKQDINDMIEARNKLMQENDSLLKKHKEYIDEQNKPSLIDDFANPNSEMPTYMDPED